MPAAVGLIQTQPTSWQTQPLSEEGRVTDATLGIFDRFKQTVSRAWGFLVIGVRVASDKVSFVFFRVLAWIHPSLGPQVEIFFLRIRDIWQAMRHANELEDLRRLNSALETRLLALRGVPEENQRLASANAALTTRQQTLEQQNEGLSRRLTILQQREGHFTQIEGAVVQSRNSLAEEGAFLTARNGSLMEDNRTLLSELEALRADLTRVTQAREQLQRTVEALQQEAITSKDEEAVAETQRQIAEQMKLIVDRLPTSSLPGGYLDESAQNLFPLWVEQLQEWQTALENMKIPPRTQVATCNEAMKRILAEQLDYLGQVPDLLRRHRDARDPVRLLFTPTRC